MCICFPPPSLSTSAARRQLDSNQRAVSRPYGFAVRRIRPLCHTVPMPARTHCSASSRVVYSTSASQLRHAGGDNHLSSDTLVRVCCSSRYAARMSVDIKENRRLSFSVSRRFSRGAIEHHIPLSIAAVCQPIGCRRHRKPSTRGVEHLRSHSYVRSQR